ncbi:oligosaccharide flippase family protein [Morganella morganii]|uniref:lipopolysaccharide biosynthesis protein n=1 Tax=Morganella morganii TaxID=582 RepID=UPI0032DAF866
MLAKDTILYAIANGLNRGAMLLIFPILLTFLTIEEYGQFNLIIAISQFLIPFFCLSGTAGIVREGASNPGIALYLTYKLGLIVLGNILFFSVLFFISSSTLPYWIFLSIILGGANTLFELLMAFYRSLHRKDSYFYISVIKASAVVISVLVGKYEKLSLIDLIYLIFFIEIICIIIISIKIYFSLNKIGYEKFPLLKVFSYSLFIIPHGVAIWAMSSSDRLIINYYLSEYELGIYSLAYTIATVQALINSGLGSALPQIIYREYKKWESINLRVRVIILFTIASTMLIFSMIVLISLDKYYLKILDHHSEVNKLLSILFPALYLMGLYQFYSIFLFYDRRTKNIFYISSLISILNVISNILFIKKFGIIFAAYSTLGTYFLFFLTTFIYVKKSSPQLSLSLTKELLLPIVITSIFVLINSITFPLI